MNVVQDKVDDLNAVLKISIQPDDYKEVFEKELRHYRKSVELPGFRKGKVPVSLIKKKYGPGILVDEIQKMLNETLDKHIKDNELDILGQPLPIRSQEVGDWENPKDFEFAYELGLAPIINEIKLEKEKLKKYKIKVEDKMLDEEIGRMTKQYGSLVDTDKSAEKDLVYGEFLQLDADGNEMEEGIKNSTTVFVDSISDKKTKKQFLGLKSKDEVVVDPSKMTESHDDLGKMLGITHEQVHGLISKFKFTVSAVKKVQEAEIDKELFDKIFPEADLNDEKAFRELLKEKIGDQFENNSKELFRRDTSQYFIDKLKLKLPEKFLVKWTALSNEKTEEEAEVDFKFHADGLRWQLIMNKLTKDHDLKVEFDDVMEFTKKTLIDNYAQYGYPAPDEEELKQTAMRVLQNQEESNRVFEILRENMVFDLLASKANITEKEISFDKFKKMAESNS